MRATRHITSLHKTPQDTVWLGSLTFGLGAGATGSTWLRKPCSVNWRPGQKPETTGPRATIVRDVFSA